MKKAIVYCPKQKVFFKDLLVERYILPAQEFVLSKTSKLELNVLEVVGDKALVLLPRKMARKEQNTALINLDYLG